MWFHPSVLAIHCMGQLTFLAGLGQRIIMAYQYGKAVDYSEGRPSGRGSRQWPVCLSQDKQGVGQTVCHRMSEVACSI